MRLEAIDGGSRSEADGRTDDSGRVRLTGVRRGDFSCIVTGDGIATTILDGVRIPTRSPLLVRAAHRARTTLRGTVSDVAGKPLFGVRVQCANGKAASTVTNAAGAFTLDVEEPHPRTGPRNPVKWVPPLEVLLSKDGFVETQYRWNEPEAHRDFVLPGQATVTGTIACQFLEPPFRGSYTFVGPCGERVSDAMTTDRSGRFRWAGAPAARGSLHVYLDSELTGTIDVDLTAGGIRDVGTIRLSRLATLQFTKDSFDAGGSAHVSWRLPGEPDFSPSTSIVERRGWRTRAVVPSGTLEIVVWASGRLASGPFTVNVPEGGEAVVGVDLHRPSSLRLVVRRDEEASVGREVELAYEGTFTGEYAWRAIARVWAFGKRIHFDDVGIGPRQTTDEFGAVWFRRLPPGPYVARLIDGTAGSDRRIVVQEGTDETVVWDEDRSE